MTLKRLEAKKEAEANETDESIEEVEEVVEESQESTEEVAEESAEEVEEVAEEPVDEEKTALRKEIERLKAERRDRKLDSFKSSDDSITKPELRMFESLREDAFREFLVANPQYEKDDGLWDKFLDEYKDRVSEVKYAQRKGVPVSKHLFKQRLESIHNSMGVKTDSAKDEGKRELLKAQSAAKIYGAASGTGEGPTGTKTVRKRILPQSSKGLKSWTN